MKKRDIWISVAIIAAAFLLLYSYSQGKGRITIDADGAEATLRVNRGWFSDRALIKSKDGPVMMRARIYRPQRLSISTKQNGDTWLLYSRGPWGKLSKIRVKNNSTTVLQLGQPLLIKPSISKRGSQISIGLSIIDRAGVSYYAAITKNEKRLAPPKLKIVDEAGNVLTSGKFEYG